MVELHFLMPTDRNIEKMRESVLELRQDQIKHLAHLLRSWGIFGKKNSEAATWRAIKRVLRDRP